MNDFYLLTEMWQDEHDRAELLAEQLAAAQSRIAELEAEITKWKKIAGIDEPSMDVPVSQWRFNCRTFPLPGPGVSTADVTYDWKPAKSASDND